MSARQTLLLCLSAVTLASCAPDAAISPEAHALEIDTWRTTRLQELTATDSWLTLVAYHALPSGSTRIGSQASNDLVTPRGPADIGTVHRDTEGYRFIPAPGAQVLADSVVVPPEGIAIQSDRDGPPTVMRIDSLTWYVRTFQDRPALRMRDNLNPLRVDFPGLEFYPIDVKWRLHARFSRHDPPKALPVAIFTGGEHTETSPGAVSFEVDGKAYTLDITDESDTGYFVIFSDQTNGKGSYPAGRYVWFDKPAEGSDRVTLDLNRAYNPPCAFTDFATCPLPPRSHRLDAPVEAGERTFARPGK